jgi:HEXXH motif-containing protein
VSFTRVTGEGELPAVGRLRSAELGKHKALLAAIMRVAGQGDFADYERALAIPYRLLADVEASAPHVVETLLAMPQFGAWADDCVRRLLAIAGTVRDDPSGQVPLAFDLGHLALFAASAGIRSGRHFEIAVPLRDGSACVPGLGTARPGAARPWEWGVARQDDAGCRLESSLASVTIPVAADEDPAIPAPTGWRPLPRFAASRNGLRLAILLDDADPFLDRYGHARLNVDGEERSAWQRLLAEAWQILAREHQALAALISEIVRTLVPIVRPGPTRAADVTETASFGAIALSLPPDALSMAEILVHESHHAILGALMDVEPLVAQDSGFLGYAPWRDDPRPASGLLQGIFAHYGMGRFWRQQYQAGQRGAERSADGLRAAVEFGRMRAMTARACATTSGAQDSLTRAGRELLADIGAEVAGWLTESLPREAVDHVDDLATDHEVRWRLSHHAPSPEAVRALADAWQREAPPPFAPEGVPVHLRAGELPAASANIRSYLLSLRYRNPGALPARLADSTLGVDPADRALARGEHADAAGGYLRRIAMAVADGAPGTPDIDAWAGLAVARRRTGPASVAILYAERPEVIASLHALVAARSAGPGTGTGAGRDGGHPDRLASCLAGAR